MRRIASFGSIRVGELVRGAVELHTAFGHVEIRVRDGTAAWLDVRDRGTQVSLGTYVATFVYVVLALGSIAQAAQGDFVPHLSITVALALVLVDVAVLVNFIHHVATAIQLPA